MKEIKLTESAIKELQFANLQIEQLYNALDEMEVIGDTLTKAVAKNAKERHQLDKLIHSKHIFNN